MSFFNKQKSPPTLDGDEFTSQQQQQQQRYRQYNPFENISTRNMYNKLRTRLDPRNWSEELMADTGKIFLLGSAVGVVMGTLEEVVIARDGRHDTLKNSVSRVLNQGGSCGGRLARWWLTYSGFETAIKTSQLRVDDDTASVLAYTCTEAVHDGLTSGRFTDAVVGGVSSGLMFGSFIWLRNKLSKNKQTN